MSKEKKYTFVVSDESLNSYGFRVITDGIDIRRFLNNPVMFYMHERKSGIVGRWENIRKEKKRLLADAVFDYNTTLGKEIKQRVENGFLRSASIGIENPVMLKQNNIDTVVSCSLREISIVDIPANQNAVKLYMQDGQFTYNLSDYNSNKDGLKERLIESLNLSYGATDKEVLTAVEDLQFKDGMEFIDKAQKKAVQAMRLYDPDGYKEYMQALHDTKKEKMRDLITEACKQHKFMSIECEFMESISDKLTLEEFKKLLSIIPTQTLITDIINGKHNDPKNWTLNEWRKYNPQALNDDPKLYNELMEREKQSPCNLSLDYYRKNDPEYLRNNPDIYKRLIQKNNK